MPRAATLLAAPVPLSTHDTPREGHDMTKHTALRLAAASAAAALLIACGAGTDPSASPTATPDSTATFTTTLETPAPAPVPSSAAPTKPAAPTIDDGIWTVGDDFPAGTYRVRVAVSSGCYWAIYRSGTNQDDIIQNDIVDGGKPTVTLKLGQDFKTSDCGTWIKIK